MFALSVVGHPSPRSFSHAMAERAEETLRELGGEVSHHDLYAEGFEPVCARGENLCARGEDLCARGGTGPLDDLRPWTRP